MGDGVQPIWRRRESFVRGGIVGSAEVPYPPHSVSSWVVRDPRGASSGYAARVIDDMNTRQPNPSLVLAAGVLGGHAWYVWAIVATVILLNFSSLSTALMSRGRRRHPNGPPPNVRRVEPASVLLWVAILALAALIGVGVATAGAG